MKRRRERNNIPDEENVQRVLHRLQAEEIRFAERNAPHFELHALERVLRGGGSHVLLVEHVDVAEEVLRIQVFAQKPDQVCDFEKRLDLWNSESPPRGSSCWSAASDTGSASPECHRWPPTPRWGCLPIRTLPHK